MKNNKGFTMIEVLGALIIIGVLLGLIVPGISHLMARFRKDYYNKTEQSVAETGKAFFTDHKMNRPNGTLKSRYVTIDTLVEQNYISEVKDYKGKKCPGSYVVVIYKGKNKYDYYTCLKCENDDYESVNDNPRYCDPAWKTDELSYDFGKTTNYYFYYGTPKELIKENLLIGLNVVKYNDAGNELDRVIIDRESAILPTNIDEVNSKPVLDVNYKYETILDYEFDNNELDKDYKVIIYKHKAPNVSILNQDDSIYVEDTLSKSVSIKLSINDNYLSETNTKTSKYQWYINNEWKDITCELKDNNCEFILDEAVDKNNNYKFRFVTNENNLSDETKSYVIKIGEEIKYTVGFDANGGTTTTSSITVNKGASVTLLNATRDGYKFLGWYTSATEGTKVGTAGNLYSPTQDITLYAQWEKKTYTVKYVANGDTGTTPGSTTCTVGVPCKLALNSHYLASMHETFGWQTSETYDKATTKRYGSGSTVTDLAKAGETITLYSYYSCSKDFRSSKDNMRTVSRDDNKWPWKLIKIESTEPLSYTKTATYGCSQINSSNANTCIADSQITAGVWSAYYSRCKYCGGGGEYSNSVWCPVHDSGTQQNGGGGAHREICDAKTKKYSSDTCKIGVIENWTKVSKDGN